MVEQPMPTIYIDDKNTVEMPRVNAIQVKVAISNSILLIIIQISKDDSIFIISDYMRIPLSLLNKIKK